MRCNYESSGALNSKSHGKFYNFLSTRDWDALCGRFFSSLYVTAARVVTTPRILVLEHKRFRGKINIQKPKKLFYERQLVTDFVQPFYPLKVEPKPIWEVCERIKPTHAKREPHPYELILARELLQRFDNSKMIAFLHKNNINSEDEFEVQVAFHKENMMMKTYALDIARPALQGTKYEAVLKNLFYGRACIIFAKESNTETLRKIVKKTPQIILLAGILHDQLLNVNDFLKYGKMDITEARSQLVHTMQTAAGLNLNRQLTHHQTTLVSRLQQIGKNDGEVTQTNEANSEEIKPE